jgi:hypothetical protein
MTEHKARCPWRDSEDIPQVIAHSHDVRHLHRRPPEQRCTARHGNNYPPQPADTRYIQNHHQNHEREESKELGSGQQWTQRRERAKPAPATPCQSSSAEAITVSVNRHCPTPQERLR